MNWIYSAGFTVLALASADLLIKLTAGKVSNSVALLLYGSCTFIAGLGWVLFQLYKRQSLFAEPMGIVTGLGVGVAFACVTFGLYATFAQLPVSVASPLIRVGGIVVVSLIGIMLFRERTSPLYLFGMILTLSGLSLLVLHTLRHQTG